MQPAPSPTWYRLQNPRRNKRITLNVSDRVSMQWLGIAANIWPFTQSMMGEWCFKEVRCMFEDLLWSWYFFLSLLPTDCSPWLMLRIPEWFNFEILRKFTEFFLEWTVHSENTLASLKVTLSLKTRDSYKCLVDDFVFVVSSIVSAQTAPSPREVSLFSQNVGSYKLYIIAVKSCTWCW